MIEEIARWICARAGLTLGADAAFGHRLQTSPDRCILIAFNGGGSEDFYLPHRTDRMVQILARSKSYLEAYDDSIKVRDAIHGVEIVDLPVVTSGEKYEALIIQAVNPPQYIGPDVKGRHEWSSNFQFKVRKKSS